jgi:hypothetical protein
MDTKERPGKEKTKAEKMELLPAGTTSAVCTFCGNVATQLVDGEPSCEAHIEQIYEHQVEDYTRKQLNKTPWREV